MHSHHGGALLAHETAAGSIPVVTAAPGAASPMAMVFEHGYDVVLLFPWWHPHTPLEYAGSLLLLYGACLLQAWLQHRREKRQARAQSGAAHEARTPLVRGAGPTPATMLGGMALALLEEAFSIALGFALMLVLMTFNTGVFCTVVLGVLSGKVLSRHAAPGVGGAAGGTSKRSRSGPAEPESPVEFSKGTLPWGGQASHAAHSDNDHESDL